MDESLRQILAALFAAHQEIDALRRRVAELEAAKVQPAPEKTKA